MPSQPSKVSPRQLAIRWRIDVMKVLHWIHTGELPAINVARNPRGRPRYRIDEKDIAALERVRAAATSGPAKARSTRTRTNGASIEIIPYVPPTAAMIAARL